MNSMILLYRSSLILGIILSLEAVFYTLLSAIFRDDLFNGTIFIGCLVIFIGMLVSETKLEFLNQRKRNKGFAYLDYKFFYDRIIMKTMKIYTRRRIYETNKSEHFNYRSIN